MKMGGGGEFNFLEVPKFWVGGVGLGVKSG